MKRRLRVLLAIGEMSGGGSQRQLLGILQRLDRQRFAPQLYVVSSKGDLLGEVPADVPVHFFDRSPQPARWLYPGQAFRARARHLAAVLEHERIELIYDRTYHMTMIAAAAVKKRPTKRVSVVVTDPRRDFETNPERYRWLKRHLLKQAYRTADRVVGVSRGVTEAATAWYGLAPAKAATLDNFFDVERIDRLQGEAVPDGEEKRGDVFEVVAAGRLHPQKGFCYLIQAIGDLHRRGHRSVQLRILGTGPLEAELRGLIQREGMEGQVKLAGFQANPLPFFRQADLFCLSSLYEGMPNALVEAMLCRAPVLATDCPSGPREILDGGKFGGLVPAGDREALAAGILEAIEQREAWRARVPLARAHIERHFSPEAGIERLQTMLEVVADLQ